jgi:DNA repair exonuclease SbcCD nuclease subunit
MPKFLHAADLHVDSPLRNLAVFGETVAGRLRAASREALAALVRVALDEQVAFVVLAGDLFDNANPSVDATLHLARELRRLTTAGIPVYVLRGNHDYDCREGRKLWPEGVHEFAANAPETFTLGEHRVSLHGQSYPQKAVEADMTPQYPPPVAGHLNIGVLHTALEGHTGEHARYAPATPTTLANKGYAYWALGHVHEFMHLEVDGTRIVYPGNLQGRHVREPGAKGVVVATWEGTRVVDVRHVPCDVLRWHVVRVELPRVSAAEQLEAIAKKIGAAVDADRAAKRACAVRLELAGLDREHLAIGLKGLRDRVDAALVARVGDHVILEELRIVDARRVELPAVLQTHLENAAAHLAVAGPTEKTARALSDFSSVLWGQLEALGPEARERLREHLGLASENDLRTRVLELGARRLSARINEES